MSVTKALVATQASAMKVGLLRPGSHMHWKTRP
jgi:hypothetical protein